MKALRITNFVIVVLVISLFSTSALCKSTKGEINLGEQSPSKKKTSVIWNVNRAITGFRVEIKAGRPIINEIRFIPEKKKWIVGAYFNAGSNWEKYLTGSRHCTQLRVNVDKAQGSRLRLVVYTSTAKSTTTSTTRVKSGEVDMGTRIPAKEKEGIIWDVNRAITGYRVEIKKGRLIINEVKFFGGQKWLVGRWFEQGQSYEQLLGGATNVGKLRVNVDKARGDSVRLVIYTGVNRSASADDGKTKVLNKDAEKKLDDMFKGFEF